MAISLANARALTLRYTGEPDTSTNSWYDLASDVPYGTIDAAINEAEIDVGERLMMEGCENSMIVKSGTITFPASSEDVAWSTLDTSRALPGSKILQICDETSSIPKYIRMEEFGRKDRWDPASIYESARYRELRNNVSDQVALLYKDSISVYPKFSSAASLVFFYVPAFGRMNGINTVVVSAGGSAYASAPTVLVTSAATEPSTGAAASLTATVAAGAVTAITVVSKGSYYGIDCVPTIVISGGGGSGATATPNIGVASVLPDEARHALSYRAAMILLASDGRDTSQLAELYERNMVRAINALQAGRAGKFVRRRPRYQGIIP